jgi:hypothetical protein
MATSACRKWFGDPGEPGPAPVAVATNMTGVPRQLDVRELLVLTFKEFPFRLLDTVVSNSRQATVILVGKRGRSPVIPSLPDESNNLHRCCP